MSDLKPLPCPFCGAEPRLTERPDNIDGTRFFYALACYCGRYYACAHKMALEPTPEQAKRTAIEAWNRRAQPAQAVPASCGECGKKTSDGWALYCVACMEKAGLPAVTDSPPLMHSCTSSLGKTPDSTAQAGQVLTEQEIEAAWDGHVVPLFGKNGINPIVFARAIEQAVRAKLGVTVPMTDPQLVTAIKAAGFKTWDSRMWELKRQIEAHHGIVGKEGA